jgi:hypothetical protein
MAQFMADDWEIPKAASQALDETVSSGMRLTSHLSAQLFLLPLRLNPSTISGDDEGYRHNGHNVDAKPGAR